MNKPDLFRQVEAKIVSYLSRFLCFIRSESLCVRKILSHDTQQTETFCVHSKGKLDVTNVIAYAFSVWRQSPRKPARRP